MSLTELAPLHLQCVEYRLRMEGGQTRPLVVLAGDDQGITREFVLKVREPANPDNHFGGTSLASELICAVLGRALGLDVPDYAIIDVPEEFPDVVTDEAVQATLRKNVGPNFGSAVMEGFTEWNPEYEHVSDEQRFSLEDVLVFDGAMLNDDRRASRPNLLWRGKRLMPIDHSLALGVYIWRPGGTNELTTLADAQIREHCAFKALSDKGLPFDGLFGQWPGQITNADLDELRGFIPAAWEREAGHLDQIFTFLKTRPAGFQSVTMGLRRVVK